MRSEDLVKVLLYWLYLNCCFFKFFVVYVIRCFCFCSFVEGNDYGFGYIILVWGGGYIVFFKLILKYFKCFFSCSLCFDFLIYILVDVMFIKYLFFFKKFKFKILLVLMFVIIVVNLNFDLLMLIWRLYFFCIIG